VYVSQTLKVMLNPILKSRAKCHWQVLGNDRAVIVSTSIVQLIQNVCLH